MNQEEETLNMYPNPQTDDGETRLKPYVVVTREWYKEMESLLSCLHQMATGRYYNSSKKDFYPANLDLYKELLDRDLMNFQKFNEPLHMPIKEKKDKAN